MRNATRATVSTFGAFAALAGIEHGIGETLQGNAAPEGLVIASWPGSELFRVVGGEPAMTVVPNLLVTGILAILSSLIFLVWATVFVQRKNGGLVLILLSIAMLLVGGGFGPPLLGIVIGAASTRLSAPPTWWRAHLPTGSRRLLGELWPWSFASGVIAWLLLFPGSLLLGVLFGADSVNPAVPALFFVAFGLLLLTILAGFAHDAQRQTEYVHAPSTSG